MKITDRKIYIIEKERYVEKKFDCRVKNKKKKKYNREKRNREGKVTSSK